MPAELACFFFGSPLRVCCAQAPVHAAAMPAAAVLPNSGWYRELPLPLALDGACGFFVFVRHLPQARPLRPVRLIVS
ncbi:MAG: hypothetical protein HC828_19165 [Blastochloris sp.]|nr:hypothetical protein [Blastochloris sp.]